jgi:glutamate carboxypeptidase
MPAGPRRYLPRAARATIPPMRDLLDRLDGWRDEQIEFLARLVNHDSGTDDVVDVNGVGAILAERLERLGFAVRRVVNDRFGDHLVGDKPGSGPKRFLFVGHYDTVFPSGTAKQRPFRIDPQGARGVLASTT